jgi:hypothetical protein
MEVVSTRLTFKCANNAQNQVVCGDALNNGRIIEEDDGLQYVAESMKVFDALQVFRNGQDGHQSRDIVLGQHCLRQGVSAALGRASPTHQLLDCAEIAQLRHRQHHRASTRIHRIVGKRIIWSAQRHELHLDMIDEFPYFCAALCLLEAERHVQAAGPFRPHNECFLLFLKTTIFGDLCLQ